MVVISRPRLRTSHDTVVAFLRAAGCAIVRVRVRLSDASGVAVEERESGSTTAPAPPRSPKRSPITSPTARAAGLIWKRRLPSRMADSANSRPRGLRPLVADLGFLVASARWQT